MWGFGFLPGFCLCFTPPPPPSFWIPEPVFIKLVSTRTSWHLSPSQLRLHKSLPSRCVCICIPLSLLCNGSIYTFLRQQRIVGRVVFCAVRFVSKEGLCVSPYCCKGVVRQTRSCGNKELLDASCSVRSVSYRRRVCVYPPIVAGEWLCKHVLAATKNCWTRRFLCGPFRIEGGSVCIPVLLQGSGSVNTFLRQQRIVPSPVWSLTTALECRSAVCCVCAVSKVRGSFL
jgi:hypothetical protein